MSLIIPTYEERLENEKERMNIINSIMGMHSTKHLHILAVMSKQLYGKEIMNQPLSLDEFVNLLELPLLIRLSDIFQKEPSKYLANSQIQELLKNAIETYTGLEEEEQQTA